jgi:hypothetical protein
MSAPLISRTAGAAMQSGTGPGSAPLTLAVHSPPPPLDSPPSTDANGRGGGNGSNSKGLTLGGLFERWGRLASSAPQQAPRLSTPGIVQARGGVYTAATEQNAPQQPGVQRQSQESVMAQGSSVREVPSIGWGSTGARLTPTIGRESRSSVGRDSQRTLGSRSNTTGIYTAYPFPGAAVGGEGRTTSGRPPVPANGAVLPGDGRTSTGSTSSTLRVVQGSTLMEQLGNTAAGLLQRLRVGRRSEAGNTSATARSVGQVPQGVWGNTGLHIGVTSPSAKLAATSPAIHGHTQQYQEVEPGTPETPGGIAFLSTRVGSPSAFKRRSLDLWQPSSPAPAATPRSRLMLTEGARNVRLRSEEPRGAVAAAAPRGSESVQELHARASTVHAAAAAAVAEVDAERAAAKLRAEVLARMHSAGLDVSAALPQRTSNPLMSTASGVLHQEDAERYSSSPFATPFTHTKAAAGAPGLLPASHPSRPATAEGATFTAYQDGVHGAQITDDAAEQYNASTGGILKGGPPSGPPSAPAPRSPRHLRRARFADDVVEKAGDSLTFEAGRNLVPPASTTSAQADGEENNNPELFSPAALRAHSVAPYGAKPPLAYQQQQLLLQGCEGSGGGGGGDGGKDWGGGGGSGR